MEWAIEAASFFGREEQRAMVMALAERIGAQWPQTRARVAKTCVCLEDPRPYLYVSAARKAMTGGGPGLLLTFGLPQPMQHPRFYRVVYISPGRYTVHLPVRAVGEIDEELIGLIAMSRGLMGR